MLFQFGIVEIEFAGQSNIISIVEITRCFCHFGARERIGIILIEITWIYCPKYRGYKIVSPPPLTTTQIEIIIRLE